MKISVYTGGFAQTNGYLIETPNGNFLIDAPEGVAGWIAKQGVRVDDVVLTHQHYDHVLDAAAMKAAGAKLHALEDYSTELTLEALGLPVKVAPYVIDRKFAMGEPLKIADVEISLAHVPGHSTDSVTLYFAEAGLLFPGDTLFARSIGRTDLPNGSTEQLLAGIRKHLLTLPEDTKVFPGHGPSTTIGAEARGNPFLR